MAEIIKLPGSKAPPPKPPQLPPLSLPAIIDALETLADHLTDGNCLLVTFKPLVKDAAYKKWIGRRAKAAMQSYVKRDQMWSYCSDEATVLFVDQHRVGETKFADRGGDLRDLLVAVRARISGVGDQRRAPAPNNRLG